MRQTFMEPLLRENSGHIEFWAADQWSFRQELSPFISGVMITPKYADKYRHDFPVMLDNGAWGAFKDGVDIPVKEHLDSMLDASRILEPKFIVVPDVVGDGNASMMRTRKTIAPIYAGTRTFKSTLLVAVQEEMRLWEACKIATMFKGGIFIGGKSYEWKRHAVTTIRALDENIYVHVGRIWKDGDVHWHSTRAQSFDNSTYGRGQNFNQRIPSQEILSRYTEP